MPTGLRPRDRLGRAGRIAELVQDYAADLEPTAPQPLIMPAYVGTVDLSLDTYRERTLVRSKNSRGLKDALDHLGIAYRWNKRAVKFELELGREQAWEQINDRTRERIRELLGHSYRYPGKEAPQAMHFSSDSLKAAFGSLLYDYEEDPFLTWLEGLHAWDNQPRLRSWLGHVFVVNEYHELCDWSGVYMLLAPVWRAYHPGLKMDEVPVLIGRGGMGKSTAVSYTLPHGSQTAWFFGVEHRGTCQGAGRGHPGPGAGRAGRYGRGDEGRKGRTQGIHIKARRWLHPPSV